MAKRRYLLFIATENKRWWRVNYRGWPFVILIGLILAILSIIDRGGLGEVTTIATGNTCSFIANGEAVNVRTGATAASPSVQKLINGQTVIATKTLTNGFRQLADGTWVLDSLLTPVPGSVCT